MEAERRKRVVSFEDLEVFQRAYRISLEIHRERLKFPPIEQRVLGDQLRRASKSICANVAEGYGRQKRSKAEFKRFLQMAMVPAMRFEFGCATHSIWDTSRRPSGNDGATNIRRSRVCCRACPAKLSQECRCDNPSSVFCPLSGSGAFCRRRRETRESSWRLQKCECWHE